MKQSTAWHIYALELTGNRWFINRATNHSLPKLIKQHTAGKGGWFTNEHRVVGSRILETISPAEASISEIDRKVNNYVLDYATRYGYDNVRGGGYCQHQPQWPNNSPLSRITGRMMG
jgi:predicted GIY-YIG superfamily endonuclease